jgi:hypothetical protein
MGFIQLTRGHPNQQLWSNLEWNRSENDTLTERYTGLPEYISGVAAAMESFGGADSYSINNLDDGRQELIGVFTSTDAVPTWELVGNELNNAIETHPRFAGIKDATIQRLKLLAQAPSTSFANDRANIDAMFDEENTGASDLYPPAHYGAPQLNPLKADAYVLMQVLQNGTNEYIENQYVLRRSFIVGEGYNTQIAYLNLNQLYTTAEVNAEMNADGTPLPATIVFSIGNIRLEDPLDKIVAADTAHSKKDYIPTWLKKRPTVVSQGGGRWGLRFQIDQEFWLYNWNRRIYLPRDQANWNPSDVISGENWLPKVVP